MKRFSVTMREADIIIAALEEMADQANREAINTTEIKWAILIDLLVVKLKMQVVIGPVLYRMAAWASRTWSYLKGFMAGIGSRLGIGMEVVDE